MHICKPLSLRCGVLTMQCLFLVYCFAPTQWNGSLTIYHKFIRPFVLKHEKQIDNLIDRGVHAAKEGIVEGKQC